MDISIGFDNFEILKIDDRDFTVEINAYLIVKWKDSRVIINKVSNEAAHQLLSTVRTTKHRRKKLLAQMLQIIV